jgi:hypothetical protein
VERAGHYSLGLADVLHPTSCLATTIGHELVEAGSRIESEAIRSLTLKAGHFLIALGAILEEVVRHLEEHGKRLCDASVQSPDFAPRRTGAIVESCQFLGVLPDTSPGPGIRGERGSRKLATPTTDDERQMFARRALLAITRRARLFSAVPVSG